MLFLNSVLWNTICSSPEHLYFSGRIIETTLNIRDLEYRSLYSDSLRALRSGNRIPVGARFFVPVQTSCGAHLASCTNGYRESFPGVKRAGRGVDHPPPSSVEVKGSVRLYFYSPSGPLWSVVGCFISLIPAAWPEHTIVDLLWQPSCLAM
jgi:hypothetical protein